MWVELLGKKNQQSYAAVSQPDQPLLCRFFMGVKLQEPQRELHGCKNDGTFITHAQKRRQVDPGCRLENPCALTRGVWGVFGYKKPQMPLMPGVTAETSHCYVHTAAFVLLAKAYLSLINKAVQKVWVLNVQLQKMAQCCSLEKCLFLCAVYFTGSCQIYQEILAFLFPHSLAYLPGKMSNIVFLTVGISLSSVYCNSLMVFLHNLEDFFKDSATI